MTWLGDLLGVHTQCCGIDSQVYIFGKIITTRDKFSEDIDLLIYPPEIPGLIVETSGSEKDAAVQSRKDFYDWLAANISIPGIVSVERDEEFDDKRYYRSGGIRLRYNQLFGSLDGIKDGILLEAGFSQVAPNEPKLISSWAFDKGVLTLKDTIIDNRAVDIPCYHLGYSFVEKTQTIIRHFRQETADGTKKKNFMRQYYDVYALLGREDVQQFIGTEAYLEHKKKWIRGADAELPVSEHPAFLFEDPAILADFEGRYRKTTTLYYRGQIPFSDLVVRIKNELYRL